MADATNALTRSGTRFICELPEVERPDDWRLKRIGDRLYACHPSREPLELPAYQAETS